MPIAIASLLAPANTTLRTGSRSRSAAHRWLTSRQLRSVTPVRCIRRRTDVSHRAPSTMAAEPSAVEGSKGTHASATAAMPSRSESRRSVRVNIVCSSRSRSNSVQNCGVSVGRAYRSNGWGSGTLATALARKKNNIICFIWRGCMGVAGGFSYENATGLQSGYLIAAISASFSIASSISRKCLVLKDRLFFAHCLGGCAVVWCNAISKYSFWFYAVSSMPSIRADHLQVAK